jgi:hypothetical protein
MRFQPLLCLVALAVSSFLSSCSSTGDEEESESTRAPTTYTEPACTCGTERGDFLGCRFVPCDEGTGNPENLECLCATPGQDEPPSGRYIHLKSGRAYKGFVIEDDGGKLVFETAGGNEKVLSYEELQPRTVYELMNSRGSVGDFDGQLKIANYALAKGFFGHARRHLQFAQLADPSRMDEVVTEMGWLRRAAAQKELKRARKALARSDLSAAKRHLVNVVRYFPGDPAIGNAEHLLSVRFGLLEEQLELERSEQPEMIAGKLEPARTYFASALEHDDLGLHNTRNATVAIREFNEAIRCAVHAYELLTRMEKIRDLSPDLLSEVEKMKGRLKEVGVGSYLHAAYLEQATGFPRQALVLIDVALAIDPEHQGLLELRAEVEESIAGTGFGDGWYPSGDTRWTWDGYIVKTL